MLAVIGRDHELAAGADFLDRAKGGPAALVLEGEAGVGKSTVWSALLDAARADGRTVLVARPVAPEARLTLSSLADLLDGVDLPLGAIPEPQRRALDAALLRDEPLGGSLEPRLLGTAVRSVLVEFARVRPVVIALDDLQWVDDASAAVLSFALRRIGDAPVGVLAAHRTGEPRPLDPASLVSQGAAMTIRIGPLTVAALHHVLTGHLGRPVPRSLLIRVHEASRGHPLFALEILRLLEEEGVPPAGTPLPVPADVRDLVRRRVDRLPGTTRDVLLLAATLEVPSADAVERAAGRPIGDDLLTAARDDVARHVGGRIEFVHPLFAAALVSAATPTERREAHRRLAVTASDPEARARHRALAADGPSDGVAAELEAAARDAAGRGAPRSAVELMDLSIGMTPADSAEARQRRAIRLADDLSLLGDAARATEVLTGVIASAGPGPVRARARLALARLQYEADAAGAALAQAEAALADADGDPELLAHAHAMTAIVSWDDFRRREGHVQEAERLLALVPRPDPVIEGLVLMERCDMDVAEGRQLDAGVVARALDLERLAPAPSVADRFSASLGVWLKLMDDFAAARPWLDGVRTAAIEEGDDGSLPYAVSHLPELHLWTGDWAAAERHAREHHALAVTAGLESQRRQSLYNLALVHVHLGREAEARAEIEDALTAAAADGDVWTAVSVTPQLGLLELSLGHNEAALGLLRRSTQLRDQVGQQTPRRHDHDLVEALVSMGELAEARDVCDAMTARARRYTRHSALANAARSRALLAAAAGDTDDALHELEDALREHALATIQFDLARTHLVVGMVRRRRRERAAAQAALLTAAGEFESLGADLWAIRARAEADRVGVRRSSGDGLTEGERRVAELAASGLTNREVAAALFVSPKTVEANLARAYAKLGITSRAELGALLGGPPRRL